MSFKLQTTKPELVLKFASADGVIRYNEEDKCFEYDYQDGSGWEPLDTQEWFEDQSPDQLRETFEGLLTLLNKMYPKKKKK